MASTTAICNSWVRDLGIAAFDHTTTTGHTFRAAGYTSSATLDKDTTVYSATNELASGAGYTTKGPQIAQVSPVISSDIVIYDFADPSWTGLTKADFRTILIYDDTHASDASVVVIDFGATQAPSNADVTVQLPAATSTTAIIRL